MQYSYSFSEELQQEWDWSEHYASQPEILAYANHVADRFNLRPDIQFDTTVERAVFDDRTNVWSVMTSDGKTVTAKFVVLATGCLSNARMPDIRGLALLWQNVFSPLFFKDLFSAMWTPLRRRPKDEIDDGVTYGGHGWLRRRPVDSFFRPAYARPRCCRKA